MRKNSRRWHVLAGLAREHGWRSGAELGVLRGENFMRLLDMCPDLSMTGVDMWRPLPDDVLDRPGGRNYADHDLDGYYGALSEQVKRYGDRATLIRASTVEAAAMFPDGHFDFVFIDADHSAEGVSADILAWGPKVAAHGWIAGHDYQAAFPGVMRTVFEMLPRFRVFHDSVWAVPKADTVFA